MEEKEDLPHLFRAEFRRIVAVLTKFLGIEHIQAAEDIASDTFVSALEIWPYKGVPEKPAAWLYTVAKNKAKNYIHRNGIFKEKVMQQLAFGNAGMPETEIDLSETNISDSQLKMLFTVCHPILSAESQIALALRVLCGFGIDEIANAFLSNKETINKRLFRAKEKLRLEKVAIEYPIESDVENRLDNVLKTLYLLFNEGYYSESEDAVLRKELCLEAMRLMHLLIQYEPTNKPEVNALLSLMCFHASRFEARKNDKGEIVLYDTQDDTLWNYDLIAKGAYYLHQASRGESVSKYHLEAAIAYWHTIKSDSTEKWENILRLYDALLVMDYSPIAALNRGFALSKIKGKEEAIREVEKLRLRDNRYFYALLAHLHLGINNTQAKLYLEKALALTRTAPERYIIEKQILSLRVGKVP